MTAKNRNIAWPSWVVFPKDGEKSLHWLVRLCNCGAAVPRNCALRLCKPSHGGVSCWWRGFEFPHPLFGRKGFFVAIPVILCYGSVTCSGLHLLFKVIFKGKKSPFDVVMVDELQAHVRVCESARMVFFSKIPPSPLFKKGYVKNQILWFVQVKGNLRCCPPECGPNRLISWKQPGKG